MEWAAEEALRCGGCGLPRDISMRPKGDNDFEPEPHQCHACLAKDRRIANWKGDNLSSQYWTVRDTTED